MPTPNTTYGNYMPANAPNTMPGSRQRLSQGASAAASTLGDLSGAGAPTTTTGVGTAGVGWRYTDTTAGKLYVATATDGTTTVTWVVAGSQT